MPRPEEGVHLDYHEADVLARRLVIKMAQHPEDWLEWELLPLLDEDAFGRLVAEVKSFGEVLLADLRVRETVLGIDGGELEERVS